MLSTGVPVWGGDTGQVEEDVAGEAGAAFSVAEPVGALSPDAVGTFGAPSCELGTPPVASGDRSAGDEAEVPRSEGAMGCGPSSDAALRVDPATSADGRESLAPRRVEVSWGRPNLRRTTTSSTTSTKV